ncbi:acyl-CoA dehydrogenase family protein [Streptomyces sp. YGL11-2]|uniref:acyl-CoA dehydrogenase family protein n=1 Tax=Streptomyces sp. YGL11-2 TaxID=3414028 RepID=UPI003CFACBEB
MDELTGQARSWGEGFRAVGMGIDRYPESIRKHFDLPGVRYLSTMGIPREHGNPHLFCGTTAAERVVAMEEMAFGDAGVLLGAPGPLLVGVLVSLLADDDQKKWFYQRMLEDQRWTFFALTEPERGSDASELTTRIDVTADGRPALSGRKRYVGNGARGQVGVVFARNRPGPLGINAVLVETPAPGWHTEALDTIGLCGARIGAITMDRVPVDPKLFLGRHLSPSRRGTWAFAQAFNLLRPGVAAISLGIARAAHEYAATHRRALRRDEQDRLDDLGRRIGGTRKLVRLAAAAVDADTRDGHLASAAKARATSLAADATTQVCALFGPGARLEHPVLDKLARDAQGVEFMEGTTHMQKLTLFQGLFTGKLAGDDPLRQCAGGA